MSGNVGLRDRVEQVGWLGTGQMKWMWAWLLQTRTGCKGWPGWSQNSGWSSLGGGEGRRLHRGPTEGCSSQRERRQTEGQLQRAAGVWVKMMTGGWSDSRRSGGCGMGVRQVPSLLAPARGSFLSGAAVKECTSLPCCQRRGCLGPSHALCPGGSLGPSHGHRPPGPQHCTCPPRFCPHHSPG